MDSRDELLNSVDELEERGDAVGALGLLRSFVNREPDAVVLCRLAELAKDLSEMEEAGAAFQRAIQIDPTFSLAFIGLASILLDGGDYESAETLLRKSLNFEQNEVAYCMLGVALEGLDREEEAKQNFELAIGVDPGFEEAYFNLGVLLREAEASRAEELFRYALELDRSYADAHRELGWVLSRRGPSAESNSHLQRALDLRPDDVWTYIYLANDSWRKGDLAAALVNFRSAIDLAPHRSFPLWSLANYYEELQEWEKARSLYEQALELQPDDVEANMNFGRMLKRKGELAAGRVYLERALLLEPDCVGAKSLLDEIPSGRS